MKVKSFIDLRTNMIYSFLKYQTRSVHSLKIKTVLNHLKLRI